MLEPKIIFEDDSLIVLDKPTGWITNSADTTSSQPVIEKWVAENFQFPIFLPAQAGNFQTMRHGIAHRLDKETSGVLLIAKTEGAFVNLQRQFKERLVQKTYTALVHGKVELIEGMVDETVGRLPWRRDRFGVLPGGREAVTLYSVNTKYQNPNNKEILTLLDLQPKTGRTHQIRIHLKHIGHPIVADEFYAGRKTARNDRLWCPRLFLHAAKIYLNHPETGKPVSFSSPLPADLSQPLASLVKIS